jgi:WD repeat-containing protein 23
VEGGYGGIGKRSRARDKYPAIPSDVGRALMNSGTFGDKELCEGGRERKNIKVASRIFKRELGIHTGVREQIQNRLMAQVGILLGCIDIC